MQQPSKTRTEILELLHLLRSVGTLAERLAVSVLLHQSPAKSQVREEGGGRLLYRSPRAREGMAAKIQSFDR